MATGKTLSADFFGEMNEGSLTQNPITNRGVDENVSRYTKKNLAEILNKNTADLATSDHQIKECRIVRIDREYSNNEYDVVVEEPTRTAVSSNNLMPSATASRSHGLTNLQPRAIMISPTKPQIGDWVLVDLPLVNLRNGPPGRVIKKLDGPSNASGPTTRKAATPTAAAAAAAAATAQANNATATGGILSTVGTQGDAIGSGITNASANVITVGDFDSTTAAADFILWKDSVEHNPLSSAVYEFWENTEQFFGSETEE